MWNNRLKTRIISLLASEFEHISTQNSEYFHPFTKRKDKCIMKFDKLSLKDFVSAIEDLTTWNKTLEVLFVHFLQT